MLKKIKAELLFPVARTIICLKSEQARFQSLGKKPVVHFQAPYAGQRIMLLALYEKGVLRPDVLRLLRHAKDAGLYVLAVNTLRLLDPAKVQGLVDCYIERPNFGRDFGSYKTGFLHFYAQGWDRACPRLLMINDSVYFSSERMPKFLDDMMSSEIEVLGSTENHEFEHHLGSFCIAMSSKVLRGGGLKAYWRRYRLTDVRPKVIERGEMALSRALKRTVTSPKQFCALYSAARFAVEVSRSIDLLQSAISLGRRSSLLWKNGGTPERLVAEVINRYAHNIDNKNNVVAKIFSDVTPVRNRYWVGDLPSIIHAVRSIVVDGESVNEEVIVSTVAATLMDNFIQGSQIHQNSSILLSMGLPIIKLDSLYRGVANAEDVEILASQLNDVEARELRELLFQRPYGSHFLRGWRLSAFKGGYL